MCRRLEEAESELRRNTEFTESLNQRLQDTELAVKDKDTLCSTLAREVERLRVLLMQHGVDAYNEDDEDLSSLDIAADISQDREKVRTNTFISQRKLTSLEQ